MGNRVNMPGWSGLDLIAASALAMALFGALLLLALISRAREDILASPIGWRLVSAALALFALRGLVPFLPGPKLGWIQHAAGILAASILPVGLFLVLRASDDREVGVDAGG